MINVNENGFVSARELYEVLGYTNKGRFQSWFESFLDYGFVEVKDYNLYNLVQVQKEGNRTVKRDIIDFLMTIEMAKEYSVLSRTENGKILRKYLISLDTKKEEGLLLSHIDIIEVVAMVKAAFVDSFRKLARTKHLETYLPNNPAGYDYANANTQRNKVCGINKNDIEKRLNAINLKYENIQKSLIKIDKYELIRIAIIDVMIHFGKTKEYAINVGNLAKELATKESQSFISSDNTLFPLPKEYNQIYLQLNK